MMNIKTTRGFSLIEVLLAFIIVAVSAAGLVKLQNSYLKQEGSNSARKSAMHLAEIDAAVCYYGGGMTGEVEASRQALCPVLAHFGSKDHYISLESVEAFKKAQPKVEVHVYEADHGFNCDQRGSYNAPAAAQAIERTLAFFAQHLG